jgi:hypothetical protein
VGRERLSQMFSAPVDMPAHQGLGRYGNDVGARPWRNGRRNTFESYLVAGECGFESGDRIGVKPCGILLHAEEKVTRNKRGPKPGTLKVEDGWKDAAKQAINRGKPPAANSEH